MAKINIQSTFELLATNRELRGINDNLISLNDRMTKKNKDLLEINALQKDIMNRLELTLHGLLGK